MEHAYRRGDLLPKRRQLAEAWARYCESVPATETSKVVPIGGGRHGRRPPPGWPISVRVIEVDDTGPIQTAIVERPEEPPPQLTLRHRMILAIVQSRYPKGIPPGVGIADLERLVAQKWSAA